MSDLTSSAIYINVVRFRYKLGIYQIIRLKLPLGVLRFINRGNIADFSQTEEIIIIFLIFLSLKYFGVKKYIKKNGNFIIFYCSDVYDYDSHIQRTCAHFCAKVWNLEFGPLSFSNVLQNIDIFILQIEEFNNDIGYFKNKNRHT